MTLRNRLAKLERNRPAHLAALEMSRLDQATLDAMAKAFADALTNPGPDLSDVSLSGVLARIEKMEGQDRSFCDLSQQEIDLLNAAADVERGQ